METEKIILTIIAVVAFVSNALINRHAIYKKIQVVKKGVQLFNSSLGYSGHFARNLFDVFTWFCHGRRWL